MPRSERTALAALLLTLGCATLQQIAALRHVTFALDGVGDARLAGVPLGRIASYQDLTAAEAGRLALVLARNELPFDFRVDVVARNPEENRVTARLVRLAWSLHLDGKETINGVLDTAYALPPGQAVVVPLRMGLDLRRFFEGTAESLVNLAAGIAGRRADPTRIELRAVPTIDTPLGPIAYPSPITIRARTGGDGSGRARGRSS